MADIRKTMKLLHQIKSGEKNLSEFESAIKAQADNIAGKDLGTMAKQFHDDLKNHAIGVINRFYAHRSGSYNRTKSFHNLYMDSEINSTDSKTMYIVTFYFKAEAVTVNPWAKYPGNNEWAFDADFINGYHGGPKRVRGYDFGWGNVARENVAPFTSIYNHAVQVANRLGTNMKKR